MADSDRTLTDEDIETVWQRQDAAVAVADPQDADGTDSDGSDGDATDATDGDAGDADGQDA